MSEKITEDLTAKLMGQTWPHGEVQSPCVQGGVHLRKLAAGGVALVV